MRNPALLVSMTLVLSACGTTPSPASPSTAAPGVSLTLPATSLPVNSRLTFTATLSPAGAYLYVFNVDPDGKVDQFLPNRYDTASADTLRPAGQVVSFPAPDAGYFVLTSLPTGTSTLLAFVSSAPLNLGAVSAYEGQAAFATGKVSGLDALSMALKAAAADQPGTLSAETRATLTITP